MVSRINHTSYVINFDAPFKAISELLKPETDALLSKVVVKGLDDWEVQFRAVYGEGNMSRIYKKTRSFVKDKQKEIVIHIPIPSKDIVDWGVEENQHINLPPVSNPQDFSYIDICFADYTNRFDYIVAQMRKAILFCLEDGFTVNGKKVKLGKAEI